MMKAGREVVGVAGFLTVALVFGMGLVLWGCCEERHGVVVPSPAPTTQAKDEVRRPSEAMMERGAEVYDLHCLTCHQHDGGGVPGMQPSLVGAESVTGDARRLIEMVLLGIGAGDGSLASSGGYAAIMPAFDYLKDEDIAACLTYLRWSWGHEAGVVSAEEVGAVREAVME